MVSEPAFFPLRSMNAPFTTRGDQCARDYILWWKNRLGGKMRSSAERPAALQRLRRGAGSLSSAPARHR